MAVDRQEHYGNSTSRALGVPRNATPSSTYLGMSPQLEPTTALSILTATKSFITNWAKYVLHGNVRLAHGPLAQGLSNSASSTCTSMASPRVIATSSGSIWSIGDPSICGATHLGVWGDNAGPHGPSAPITVALESDHGSSYASPSDPSMTTFQSRRHCHLFGFTSSSGSVCLALSSLSSSHSGSVSMVCSSGCCASSSSDVKESSGRLTIQWAPSLVIQATSTRMCGT